MHIHFFTKYTPAGASSRYRSYQYLPVLVSLGWRVGVSPLFDDAYLSHKYAHGRARLMDVARAFARRLRDVWRLPRGSVVVIEYELLPYCPALLERWLAFRGCRMVVDYDDALFHQYDAHRNPWVRRLLGGKIGAVMRLAHTVVAGNAYLADYAKRAGAKRVEVIPTVIDLARYRVKAADDAGAGGASDGFTIGWIGSPSTARYLRGVAPALAQLCRDDRARLRLFGSGPVALPGVAAEVTPWTEDAEVDEICGFDVGIMPLPDEPWARGKCGFKLIQYMACGLPVVASPVGVNSQIVEHGVTGFLAETPAQWVEALQTLAGDAELRQRMGQAGRVKVEREYCIQVTGPRMAALLQSVASKAGHRG